MKQTLKRFKVFINGKRIVDGICLMFMVWTGQWQREGEGG